MLARRLGIVRYKVEIGFGLVIASIHLNRESDCEQQNRMSIGMLTQRLFGWSMGVAFTYKRFLITTRAGF